MQLKADFFQFKLLSFVFDDEVTATQLEIQISMNNL